MMDKNQVYNDEMEQMRQDMSELRSLLSEQKIVNERLMRRAMKSEAGQGTQGDASNLVALFVHLAAFLLHATVVGAALVVRLGDNSVSAVGCCLLDMVCAPPDGRGLAAGDLLKVAGHIVEYKRLGNNWLKFSIRFSSSGSLASSTIVDKVWRKTWPTACYGEA